MYFKKKKNLLLINNISKKENKVVSVKYLHLLRYQICEDANLLKFNDVHNNLILNKSVKRKKNFLSKKRLFQILTNLNSYWCIKTFNHCEQNVFQTKNSKFLNQAEPNSISTKKLLNDSFRNITFSRLKMKTSMSENSVLLKKKKKIMKSLVFYLV